MAAPQKLDLYLEALTAFQDGAATLKAGDPLCLQQQEGGRLACVTQTGTAVGLVPADKRGLLSRGPWSGTVRSVKRIAAAASAGVAAGVVGGAAVGGAAVGGADKPAGVHEQPQQNEQRREEEEQQQQPASATNRSPQLVQQVLVRFTPEEQRWERRQDAALTAGQQLEEEDTARLSREQFEQLAANEELRWMLRDERLQKVVADIDAAPDRERALVRALQAPNFKEFAEKVLAVVAPDAA